MKYFRHNDMEHLESLLQERMEQEKKVHVDCILECLWTLNHVRMYTVKPVNVDT